MPIAKKQNITSAAQGGVLLDMRKRRSLTQAEFAATLGVPKSTYVSWERGEAEPPLRLASIVKESLGGRAAAELFGLLDEPEHIQGSIDWVELGKLCREVEAIARRGGYDFNVADIVEIAGIIFERGENEFQQGLREAEQLLRIGKRLPRASG